MEIFLPSSYIFMWLFYLFLCLRYRSSFPLVMLVVIEATHCISENLWSYCFQLGRGATTGLCKSFCGIAWFKRVIAAGGVLW